MWLASLVLLTAQSAPVAPAASVHETRLQAQMIDDSCQLFTATQRQLLDAAVARSRDDAVLSGDPPGQLAQFEARLSQTYTVRCTGAERHPGVVAHREQIERLSAFTQARFEGRHQHWDAWRGDAPGDAARWRIVQPLSQDRAALGIYQQGDDVGLALALRSPQPPAIAVAHIRDAAREPLPVDLTAGGLLPAPGNDPVSAWGAPSDRQSRIFADRTLTADRAAALAPAGGDTAYGFQFPDALVAQLGGLTPREGIQVDLFDATGAVTARYWVEVGGLNAALAFLSLPLMQTAPVEETEAENP